MNNSYIETWAYILNESMDSILDKSCKECLKEEEDNEEDLSKYIPDYEKIKDQPIDLKALYADYHNSKGYVPLKDSPEKAKFWSTVNKAIENEGGNPDAESEVEQYEGYTLGDFIIERVKDSLGLNGKQPLLKSSYKTWEDFLNKKLTKGFIQKCEDIFYGDEEERQDDDGDDSETVDGWDWRSEVDDDGNPDGL